MQSIMWRLATITIFTCPLNESAAAHRKNTTFTAIHHRNTTFDAVSGFAAGVKAEAEIKQTMTMDNAVALLSTIQGSSQKFVQYIQDSLEEANEASMLQGTLRKVTSSRRRRSNQQGYAGVDSAKKKLNQMIHETAVKLDLELIRCSTYERSQLAHIETLRQDISTFDAAAAAAASEMLRAQAQIAFFSAKLPEVKYELLKLQKECREAKLDLERQLQIVKADISVMERVMAMTACNSATMLLLECQDPLTGRTYTEYNPTLVQQMTSLQHPDSQKLAKEVLYPTDKESEGGLPMLALAQEIIEKRSTTVVPTTPSPSNVTIAPSKSKQRAKCSISGSPMCPKLRERFMDIATGIEDKRKELEAALRELEKRCADDKAMLEAKISLYEQTLRKEETALAQATAEKVNNEEQSRLTRIDLAKAMKEYDQTMAECRTNIENFRTERCGLEKIRGELYKMKGQNVFLQDCEVTDWSAEECSTSCGGGIQSLTRTIVTSPVGGAACPPLAARQSCNEDPCPVDCIVEDWTAWSECSAKCGGGVRSKARVVKRAPEHSGDPCGEISKTEACNVHACDVDCSLGEWTAWSACSKECDGGSLARVKEVISPTIGAGKCPAERSAARMQQKPCNVQPCINSTTTIMTCVAKIDVILVLDGSGSLGQAGWDATVTAAAAFARAMTGDVNLAALLFSGPTSYPSLWMCTGEQPGTPDMVKDCGIQWVSHFSNDTGSVATAIEGLTYPQKTTLTSLALSTAETELSAGRQDAESVVVVVTDGKPLSEKSTTLAATSIKKKARLLWVTVGRYVPKKDVRRWASFPWQENVVPVNAFNELATPGVLNHIIADMCPDILSEGLGRTSV